MYNYCVIKVYDDNSAEILDLNTYSTYLLNEQDLIKLDNSSIVLGLDTFNNHISRLNAYSVIKFDNDADAYDYCEANNLNLNDLDQIGDYYFCFERTHKVFHVDYVVCYETEIEQIFVGPKNSYVAYLSSAKKFDKKEAQLKAAMMTKKSKTGKFWRAVRLNNG